VSIVWLDFRVLYIPAAGTLAAGIAYYVRAARRARGWSAGAAALEKRAS
jgi:hypothetical protein